MANKDRLEEIFRRQKKFQLNFCNPEKDSFDTKLAITKEYVFCMVKECTEVLDTISWKIHRSKEKKIDEVHYLEELIDVQKYLLNLLIVWGITPSEFYKEFNKKSNVVEKRYESERTKSNI